MYVLDTNTLIYFFKGMGRVADRLLHESPRAMSIPAMVLFELQVGIQKSSSPRKRLGQLREMVSAVRILPFGAKEAGAAAKIRARLESKGRSIGPYDVLIAGTALAHGATLVTHNRAEFGRVENLAIEDWY